MIQVLHNCAAYCQRCANACLGEEDVKKMVNCIRNNRECAELCLTAASLLAMDASHAREVVQLCAKVCRACAEECGKHDDEHCKDCAKACRECAEAYARF